MASYAVSPLDVAGDMSSSFNGTSFNVGGFHDVAVSSVVTNASTLNGTLKLQGSVDGSNWADVPSTSATLNSNGTTIFNVANNSYQFVRLVWTRNAGSGTLDSKVGTVMTGRF